MIEPRELLPHFEVKTIDGGRVDYSTISQRKNLVLVGLAGLKEDDREAYARQFIERLPELRSFDAECVITSDSLPRVPAPAIVVADRWGEVQYVGTGSHGGELPTVDDVLEWLGYVQQRCPECEGEAR